MIVTRQLVMEGVWVVGRQNLDIADTLHLRDIAMAANLGTKIAITGFLWMIVTRLLVMEGVWVVGQQNADIAVLIPCN